MNISYSLRVTYRYHSPVWREIELLGVQTLHDLHVIIQQAFAIGGDSNNFAFFMSGHLNDGETEYSVRMRSANRGVSTTHLLNLSLGLHQRFIYFFAYASGLPFAIEVIRIDPDAPDGHYPKILKSHGQLNLHKLEHGHDALQHEIDRGDEAEELEGEDVELEPEAAGADDGGDDDGDEGEEEEESEEEVEAEEEAEEEEIEQEEESEEEPEESEEIEAEEEEEHEEEGEEHEEPEEEHAEEEPEHAEAAEHEEEEPEEHAAEQEVAEEKEAGEEPEEEHESEEEPEPEESEAHEAAEPAGESEAHEESDASGEQPVELEAEPAPSGESGAAAIGGDDLSNASGEGAAEEAEGEGGEQ